MYSDAPVADPRQRLLGGWRDLREDVARLQRAIPGAGPGCSCEVQHLDERVQRIEEDALRSLPAIVDCLADNAEALAAARLVEAQLAKLFGRFRSVHATYRGRLARCRRCRLASVKKCAIEILETLDRLEDEIIGPGRSPRP